MFISVLNKSSRVTDDDVKLMTRAVAKQVRYHAVPAWGHTTPHIAFHSNPSDTPPGAQTIIIFDSADQQGALGYHDVGPDHVAYSKVFAGTTLDAGGTIFDGPLSVSAVFSHEALEMMIDPRCNDWWDNWNGKLYAAEVGDPVEGDAYEVSIDNRPVSVSNFILPAWADPNTPAGSRVDWMGKCPGPFQMTPGGYVIVADVSGDRQEFNKQASVDVIVNGSYPTWRTATKLNPAARTTKRIEQVQGGHTPPPAARPA